MYAQSDGQTETPSEVAPAVEPASESSAGEVPATPPTDESIRLSEEALLESGRDRLEIDEAAPPSEGPAAEHEEAIPAIEKPLPGNDVPANEQAIEKHEAEVLANAEAAAPTEAPVPETTDPAPDLGTGNFAPSPFRVSVSVREGYDDNVYTTSRDKVDSFYSSGNVVFDYKFGNARTEISLQAFGGLTYYYNQPFGRGYDINSGLSITLSHKATPRLGLAANVYLAYQSEPNFETAFGINRRNGNYFYTSDRFSLSYQFTPRFSTTTSYTLGVLNYEDSSVGIFEDRFEHTFGNEFRYLVVPTTSLVGEYRFQITDYVSAPRNSTTHFFLAGFDHSFSPRFDLSVRGGVEFREFEQFGKRTSPYGEATVNYALGKRTSLTWTNRYGLDEPDIAGTTSRSSFRTGLRGNYAFSPRFSTTVGAYYQHDKNEEFATGFSFMPAFSEDLLDLSLGVRYEFTRIFAGLAGYNRTEVLSDITLREYQRNRYYLGLNAAF
ncbi:MAG: outer membrane beta-barrel protein [Chthoniobacterales bacterium]